MMRALLWDRSRAPLPIQLLTHFRKKNIVCRFN